MNIIKEAQSAFNFATYYPLLCRATADNDSITPGYTQEEVIKISFLSHQHRVHLLDFLLTKLFQLGWSGKQKIVRLLSQLCQKGHYEVRILLRQKDELLRKAASHGGPPDPVLDNTPQLFFNSLLQELRSYIFDPAVVQADESTILQETQQEAQPRVATGYGSSENTGKYEGFGSASTKKESIVDQVIDMVGKVVVPDTRKKGEELVEGLLKEDKAHYQPFVLVNTVTAGCHHPTPPPPIVAKSISVMTPSLHGSFISPRTKAHVSGKVGGGWESDDDDEDQENTDHSSNPVQLSTSSTSSSSTKLLTNMDDSPQFIQNLLNAHPSWPVDFDSFSRMCKDYTLSNSHQLSSVADTMKDTCAKIESGTAQKSDTKEETLREDNHKLFLLLLFVEYGLSEDLILLNQFENYFNSILVQIYNSKAINSSARIKARKIHLILMKLLC